MLRSLLCIITFLLAPIGATTETPTVMLGSTEVKGVSYNNGVNGFLGLPFAQPPVGKLRWRAPIPWQPTMSHLDATAFGPACMQSGSGLAWYHDLMNRVGADPSLMAAPRYSEDCLYLNVWAPEGLVGARTNGFPVLVFIHGGSNTGGWSYEPNYHGEKLAARGIIVVTVAYRLGVFGWLAHPDMEIQNPALYDLAAALDWVERYIHFFGGNPENITLSGESAGAANALHLAISPLTGGRVRRVIHQSGGWQLDSVPEPETALELGIAFTKLVTGPDGSFEDMREVPAHSLLAQAPTVYSDYYFDPIKDRESLPETLAEVASGRGLPNMELLIGSNLNERLMYIQPTSTAADFMEGAVEESKQAAILAALGSDPSDKQVLDRLGTAIDFACPSLAIAKSVNESGGRAWVYQFERTRPGFEQLGAYHGAELPYIFGQHDPWMPTDEVDHQLSEEIQSSWVQFVERGDPSYSGVSAWTSWNHDSRHVRRFGADMTIEPHPLDSLCALIRGP